MKKWKSRICITTGVLALTGLCSSVSSMAALLPDVSEEALQKDARETVEEMRNGDYKAVTEKFDETMAAQLNEKALETGWESVTADIGDYVEEVSVEGAQANGYYAVSVVDRYENNGVTIRVVYDTEGKIAGMQMNYATLEEERESEPESEEVEEGYIEVPMTVTADSAFPLDALLALPDNVEKPPVVILVQGSGCSDKNEQINENKPFQDIARGLAKQGIAVLRYDKRYFVNPEAAPELSKINLRLEVLDDVSAAIDLMEHEEQVDTEKVFVLGHSLGGMLVPAIACEHPELSGVISMAGTLRPLWEVSYDQVRELYSSVDETTLSEEQKVTLEEQKKQMEEDYAVLEGDFSEVSDDTTLQGIPAGYWKSIAEYQGMHYIDQVTMPILVLQGSADFQVYPETDYKLWEDSIGDRENVTLHLYEGLNHLFMPAQGKRDLTEYQVKGHVDETVINDIAAFIKEIG